MRYLIDTNIFLFYTLEKDKLSKEVFELLWDTSNTINISSRSIEEILPKSRVRFYLEYLLLAANPSTFASDNPVIFHALAKYAANPDSFKVSVVGANSKMLLENAKIVPVGELEF